MLNIKVKVTKRLLVYIVLVAAAVCGTLQATAQQSVLADGSWWRLEVTRTGVYAVGVADVPALQGVAVDRINMYGMAGNQLPTDNRRVPTTGLTAIAIDVVDRNGNGTFDSGDEVLFFGEGCDVWRYHTGDARWEMQRHTYASANYYFLTTTSAAAPHRIGSGTATTADTTVASYTAVAVVNNDMTNIYKTGQLWMGEKFSAGNTSRSFTLALPSTATGIRMRYALANKSTANGRFDVSTTGLSRTHFISASKVYTTVLESTTASAQSLTFGITYTPGENSAEGYLDYIELTGHVPLAFTGSQLMVRNDQGLGHATVGYTLNGGNGARVWEVTHAGAERELQLTNGRWTDSIGGEARQYIVFGANRLLPASVSAVANQNLRGAAQADYIVVCNPQFRTQAERLAALHAINDDLSTLVVTDRQVYNEYSGGKQDPMAIRTFLRSMRERHPDAPPRYLLLFGKATYDNRDLLGYNLPTVVTYETEASFDDQGASYCSDDMMGYLDSAETGASTQNLDIAIGRLPARNAAEADHLVDKIEGYLMRSDLHDESQRGDWRNYIALLSDDADPSHPGDTAFVHSSEATANRIKQQFPVFNIDRLYADSYHQQSGAIGSFYPDLNNALRQRVNYGCLLMNYIGHGSIKYIGTERYVEPGDIVAYSNIGRTPLFVTSTCSYGYHDLPDDQCGAELCVLAQGAAIAVVSASRPISHIERFNTDVVLFALDHNNTIGEALRMAKNRTAVSPCIGLTGDPALRLSHPQHEVVVTHIDGHAVDDGNDTATALSQVTVSGEIRDANGQRLDDFDGTVYPIVFDRESQSTTLANDNPDTEVRFAQQKSILYKGAEPVRGGRFEYTFTVPRDVPYQFAAGKLSHYAKGGSDDAAGQYGRLLFGGLNEDVDIRETRPVIELYVGDTNFRNGGLVGPTPTLLARLSDSIGINAFGSGLGHDITATLDGNAGSTIVLNDFYEADLDDSRRGSVRYTLEQIAPGRHTLTLKAWNIWGYSSTATIAFRVGSVDETDFSTLAMYPNPANSQACFHIETNSPETIAEAVLHIYSPQGALIYTTAATITDGSYVVGPVRWDLSNVKAGIYMARMLITTTDGEIHQSATKCIVR